MQGRKRAGIQKFVGKSDLTERRMNAGTHQEPGYGLAEAADDRVVLGNDYQASGLAGLTANCVGIERPNAS